MSGEPVSIAARLDEFRARHGIPVDVDGDDLDLTDVEAVVDDRTSQRWASFVPPRFLTVDLAWLAAEHPDVAPDVATWSTSGGSTNLLLVGPVGTGKTGTALAACRPRVEAGVPARYAKLALALEDMRPDGPPGSLQRLLDVQLLVVDDVGAERPTEWTAERIATVLDHRWEYERPTVVTTNLGPRDLEAWIGPRAYSRLVGSGSLAVRLSGEDRRRAVAVV